MNDLQLQIEKLKEKISPNFWKAVQVDEGWYQLVIDCDKELTAIDPNYIVIQIKEKFGVLRYYFEPSDAYDGEAFSKMNAIVQKYEELSAKTCEASGEPGVPMKSIGGWYKTLNPEYAASKMHYAKYSEVKEATKDTE